MTVRTFLHENMRGRETGRGLLSPPRYSVI
jgi:hypothetical protein